MQVPPQEMLSRDSVTVSVDAVCFYKVHAFFLLYSREGCQKKTQSLVFCHLQHINMGQRGYLTILVVKS